MNEEHPEDSSNLTPKMRNAMGLISALCDDRITPEQFHELESLLRDDPEVGRFYVSIMHLNSALHNFASYFAQPISGKASVDVTDEEEPHQSGLAFGMDETMVLRTMSEPESVDSENAEERYPPSSLLSDRLAPKNNGIPRFFKGGAAALLLLGLGISIYVLNSPAVKSLPQNTTPLVAHIEVAPPSIPIATLDLMSKPVWGSQEMPPKDGNFVAGQLLSLTSGDVQLSLHRGGRLVIEGPAELSFISDDNISLHFGKIVATKPGGGLVINCPNGSVTDLGTEFGVAVDHDGGTEVAVFEGRVSASLASTATTQNTVPLLLTSGQAAVMSDKSLTVSPEGGVPQRFVCNLLNDDVMSLDVTDLVSGGNGTSHRRGIGIDAATGNIGLLRPVEDRLSDGKYHKVMGYPVVDGACIPDGTKGPMVVDSAGHQFQFSTTGNSAYNNIYTGGKIPWPVTKDVSTVLDGVDYSTPDHGLICIHPNNAMTLDLDAIRRIYPDKLLTAFHCRVGNTRISTASPKNIPVASVYVLIDGTSRYGNDHVTNRAGSFVINVPLLKQDRFLTLASTDTHKAGIDDWIIWTDARVDLSADK